LIDPKLEEFATGRQAEYLKAVNEHGSHAAAAIALGVSKGTIGNAMVALARKAASKGYAPEFNMTRPAPDGFQVKGTSTYFDGDGNVRAQWVKTTRDHAETEAILREFVGQLCEDVKPLPPMGASLPSCDKDLLAVYVLGDPHFALMSWEPETGANFDLATAEKLTCAAVDRLLQSGPSAGTGLLLNLGDMFHADNQRNVTVSGHQLDVDGRWKKTLQVGLRAMVYCVRRMLEKHDRVIFRINGGNHDGHSSYALALMMDCYFRMEPRVEVDLSPATCWYLQFGEVLIGSTHGDTIKGADLPGVMAADEPKAWGETSERRWMVGHVHHQDIKEYRGATVEYFRTLAPGDAWHRGQGYRSGRDMQLLVFHREDGLAERHVCNHRRAMRGEAATA
jgi:hypothetical protein